MAGLGTQLRSMFKNTRTQTKGTRKGQPYVLKRGKSGRNVRVYGSGETALQSKPNPNEVAASLRKRKPHGVELRNAEVSEAQRGTMNAAQREARAKIGHGVQAHNDDITEARRQYAKRKTNSLQTAATAMSRVQKQREASRKARNSGGRA